MWHNAQPGAAVSANSSPTASAAASSSRLRPSSIEPDADQRAAEDRERDNLNTNVRNAARDVERRTRQTRSRQHHRIGVGQQRYVRFEHRDEAGLGTRPVITQESPPRASHAEATASSPRKSRWSEASHIAMRAAPHMSSASR